MDAGSRNCWLRFLCCPRLLLISSFVCLEFRACLVLLVLVGAVLGGDPPSLATGRDLPTAQIVLLLLLHWTCPLGVPWGCCGFLLLHFLDPKSLWASLPHRSLE